MRKIFFFIIVHIIIKYLQLLHIYIFIYLLFLKCKFNYYICIICMENYYFLKKSVIVFCFIELCYIFSIIFSRANKASKTWKLTSGWSKKLRSFSMNWFLSESREVEDSCRLQCLHSSSTLNVFSKMSALERTPHTGGGLV